MKPPNQTYPTTPHVPQLQQPQPFAKDAGGLANKQVPERDPLNPLSSGAAEAGPLLRPRWDDHGVPECGDAISRIPQR